MVEKKALEIVIKIYGIELLKMRGIVWSKFERLREEQGM